MEPHQIPESIKAQKGGGGPYRQGALRKGTFRLRCKRPVVIVAGERWTTFLSNASTRQNRKRKDKSWFFLTTPSNRHKAPNVIIITVIPATAAKALSMARRRQQHPFILSFSEFLLRSYYILPPKKFDSLTEKKKGGGNTNFRRVFSVSCFVVKRRKKQTEIAVSLFTHNEPLSLSLSIVGSRCRRDGK